MIILFVSEALKPDISPLCGFIDNVSRFRGYFIEIVLIDSLMIYLFFNVIIVSDGNIISVSHVDFTCASRENEERKYIKLIVNILINDFIIVSCL